MSFLPRLKLRDRRALLLGVIVLAPFAAFRFGVAPWLQRTSELRDVLASERDLLAREQGVLLEAESFPRRSEGLAASLRSAEPWLLPGSNAVAAAGTFSRYVAERALAAAILVEEAETRDAAAGPTGPGLYGSTGLQADADPLSAAGPLRPVSLFVRAQGDLEGIARFLHDLENGSTLVTVRELTLRPAGINDGDLERGQLMTATFLLTGYWLQSEAAMPLTGTVGGAPPREATVAEAASDGPGGAAPGVEGP